MKKCSADTASAAVIPSCIRSVGDILKPADRDYLRHNLDQKLAKFAPAVHRTSGRVEDVNGSRGGVDKSCLITVVLTRLLKAVVENHHGPLKDSMDKALGPNGTHGASRHRASSLEVSEGLKGLQDEMSGLSYS